jgi:hypothetical protein
MDAECLCHATGRLPQHYGDITEPLRSHVLEAVVYLAAQFARETPVPFLPRMSEIGLLARLARHCDVGPVITDLECFDW